MTRTVRKILGGLLVLTLASCDGSGGLRPVTGASGGKTGGPGGATGSPGGKPGSAGGTSGNPSGGSIGSPGGQNDSPGGAGSGGAIGGTGGFDGCSTGVPVTSQVPRLTNTQYDRVVKDLLNMPSLASAGNLPPSSLLAPDSTGDLTDLGWAGYLAAADKIAGEVMAGSNKAKFLACDPAGATCLTDTIKAFGRKAFRRPLTDAEVTSFQRLTTLSPAGTPVEVAEAILYAFLVSPSFIMLPELAQDKEGTAIKLNSYEVATRLSFLIWGSVPDDLLNTAADAGKLQTRDQIFAQAQRMINDETRTAPTVVAFHHAYAGFGAASHWDKVDHDTTRYPQYSSNVREAMMAELDDFFQEVGLGGSLKDLFLKNAGFVNRDTAPVYGLDPAAFGPERKRVDLSATDRPGFLTRIGFLSSYSSYQSTNPMLRGAFITNYILGIDVGPPPPSTNPQPPIVDGTTQRQMVEGLTSPAACVGCHKTFINPPGFVLERYDAIGSLQTKDPLGGDIDGTADVSLSTTDKRTIKSPLELMTAIANQREVSHKYAEQFVAFATGRAPNPLDACLVEQLTGKVSQDGYRVLSLFPDYTQADSFRVRTLGN